MTDPLAAFLRTDLGRTATPAEVRALGAVDTRDAVLPPSALYAVRLLELRGALTADEAVDALADNRQMLKRARARLRS